MKRFSQATCSIVRGSRLIVPVWSWDLGDAWPLLASWRWEGVYWRVLFLSWAGSFFIASQNVLAADDNENLLTGYTLAEPCMVMPKSWFEAGLLFFFFILPPVMKNNRNLSGQSTFLPSVAWNMTAPELEKKFCQTNSGSPMKVCFFFSSISIFSWLFWMATTDSQWFAWSWGVQPFTANW